MGQSGFPNGGVSFPATGEGRSFTWGDGLVRTPPGVYMLCWCHAPYNNGSQRCTSLWNFLKDLKGS